MVKAINTKLLVVFIIVISFALFGKTLNHQFVWDDERSHLTKHPDVMNGNIKAIWKKPYDGMYIPVTYTIWSQLKKIAYSSSKKELNPRLFHFTNILVHTLNALLVFALLLLLFKNNKASFVGALLFLVHPLQVESVAWVSEFRGVLAAFFSLLSLYIFLKNTDKINSLKQIIFSNYFLIATLFFILALLSKPSAVVLPFVVLILFWSFYNSKFKTVAQSIFLWFVLFIPIALITSRSQTNDIIDFIVPLWQRPLLASYSIVFYFYKIVCPFSLSACYGITPETIVRSWEMYVALIFLFVITIFSFLKREQYKTAFTAYIMIIFCLLPVIGLVSFYYQRYSNVADRYMYFPLFAISIIVAYLWNKPFKNDVVKYIIGAFIIISTGLSFVRVDTWKNEFSMWDNAMQQNPNQWNAAYNRGVQYGKAGKLNEAIADYTTALKYKANDSKTLTNRANAYGMLNKFDESIADYSLALKQNENDASIYYNRALTYYYAKNIKACTYDLQKAIQLGFKPDPKFVQAVKDELKKQFGR